MPNKYYQIAMDGPAGAGKSTIAKLIAKKLNFTFINSGAIYRTITYALIQKNISVDEPEKVAAMLKEINIKQIGDQMILDGVDISNEIRTPEISSKVAYVGKLKEAREYIKKVEKDIASYQNIVIEGRDTTTAVFPNASLKCWVFAAPEIRAKRRWEQDGKVQDLDKVLADVITRDKMDSERELDPMRKAEGSLEVDTSYISIDEAIEIIINKFKELV
jgi:cytidylate kinase